jgi:hypothetical protein
MIPSEDIRYTWPPEPFVFAKYKFPFESSDIAVTLPIDDCVAGAPSTSLQVAQPAKTSTCPEGVMRRSSGKYSEK